MGKPRVARTPHHQLEGTASPKQDAAALRLRGLAALRGGVMGAVRPLHPTPDPIPLGDVEIRWDRTYSWWEVEPVLRLGGARALGARLRGLSALLEGHADLDPDETIFVRTCLEDLAEALYVSDDGTPGAAVVVRRAPTAAEKSPF
jgi:hypothetical protein